MARRGKRQRAGERVPPFRPDSGGETSAEKGPSTQEANIEDHNFETRLGCIVRLVSKNTKT